MAKNVVSRQDIRREMAEQCIRVLEVADRNCLAPCVPDREAPRPLRHSVWMLRRAFAGVATAEVIDSVIDLSRKVAAHRDSIRTAVLAWADLLDELTTAAQVTYGAKEEHGPHKKAVVKAAIVRYVHDARLDIPGVPALFEPFLYEVVAGFAVEVMYRISKQQSGWRDHTGHWARARIARKRVTGVVAWIGRGLARLAWWLVLRQNPVPPALEAAIARVAARHHQDGDVLRRSLRGALSVVVWIADHTRELVALVDAFVVALREAELMFDRGEDKRAYARELIFEFLLQEGIIAPSGVGRAVIEAVLDIFIDTVVEIFHKRNVFAHRRAPAVAAAPPAVAAAPPPAVAVPVTDVKEAS